MTKLGDAGDRRIRVSSTGTSPARKRALVLHFGTAGKVRAAALKDLQRAPGISEGVAEQIYEFYHAGG